LRYPGKLPHGFDGKVAAPHPLVKKPRGLYIFKYREQFSARADLAIEGSCDEEMIVDGRHPFPVDQDPRSAHLAVD